MDSMRKFRSSYSRPVSFSNSFSSADTASYLSVLISLSRFAMFPSIVSVESFSISMISRYCFPSFNSSIPDRLSLSVVISISSCWALPMAAVSLSVPFWMFSSNLFSIAMFNDPMSPSPFSKASSYSSLS